MKRSKLECFVPLLECCAPVRLGAYPNQDPYLAMFGLPKNLERVIPSNLFSALLVTKKKKFFLTLLSSLLITKLCIIIILKLGGLFFYKLT